VIQAHASSQEMQIKNTSRYLISMQLVMYIFGTE